MKTGGTPGCGWAPMAASAGAWSWHLARAAHVAAKVLGSHGKHMAMESPLVALMSKTILQEIAAG